MTGKEISLWMPNAIPDNVKTIAGCVSVGDLDGDGDLDIFIGGRVSGKYPTVAEKFYFTKQQRDIYGCNGKGLSCTAISGHGHFRRMDRF